MNTNLKVKNRKLKQVMEEFRIETIRRQVRVDNLPPLGKDYFKTLYKKLELLVKVNEESEKRQSNLHKKLHLKL